MQRFGSWEVSLRQPPGGVVHHGESMAELLYVRSKVRILRASTFMLPLIILFGVGVLVRQNDLELYLWLVVGFVLLRAVYLYNEWLYRARLYHLYEIAKEKESREQETEE